MTLKPCIDCGEPSDGPRCRLHRPPEKSRRERGYDAAWDRLSRRARRLQPFCIDCGATDDLQGDHSPQAWQRREQGLPIRLCDIDVVCGPCNRRRGCARPGRTQRVGRHPVRPVAGPVGKAKCESGVA